MFSIQLLTALLSVLPALSAPTKRAECFNPKIRREWGTLSQDQRDSFHNATKCLQNKPSIIESDGRSKNLYDDYTYLHFTINQTIHKVAAFYPWHRYYLLIRERDLSECGYTEGIPYWDWTRDAGTVENFKSSKIFDSDTGFGGSGFPEGDNSTQTESCVENGPYAGLQVNFPEPHCLRRSFNLTSTLPGNWTSSVIDKILEYPDYIRFWNDSERIPHDNIHRAVGGDLRRQYSPNEPLFFVHHSNIDRLWTHWQGRNETRLTDYGGNTVQNVTTNTADLDDTMRYMGLAEDRPVASLMDTLSNGLCYKYDDDE